MYAILLESVYTNCIPSLLPGFVASSLYVICKSSPDQEPEADAGGLGAVGSKFAEPFGVTDPSAVNAV